MNKCVVEARLQAQSDAQHGAYLRGAERGADTVAGRVAHQHEQPIVAERHEVVEVAAGLVRRRKSTAELVARNLWHVLG